MAKGNSLTLRLPEGTKLKAYRLKAKPLPSPAQIPSFSRIVYAAPHIIIQPLASSAATAEKPLIDWDATLRLREWLWDKGLGVAEAMDTAQRGMGLDWNSAQELIEKSLSLAKSRSSFNLMASGAGTDQLDEEREHSLEKIINAYREQMEFIQQLGGSCILMASRSLAKTARDRDDYIFVYSKLLGESTSPCILHWLGDMFDAQLNGYWGSQDLHQATETVLQLIEANKDKVKGIKVSLLNQELEVFIRNRLPEGVHLFTGDDFNYPALIKGDAQGYSDALLGIFTPIATAASLALGRLADGDERGYDEVLNPTLPLAREIFAPPTRFYKAGIGFIAWLNDQQKHFVMPAGLEAMRTISHYSRLFRYADECGLLEDPPLAVGRMKILLKLNGIIG